MFKIVTDDSCDFSLEVLKEADVALVPFYVTFDGINYLKTRIEISNEDYFHKLINNKDVFPKTSQPSPRDYMDVCIPYLKEGKDILYVTISSKLSGSNQSAQNAAEILREEYPDRKIMVVDTLTATAAHGLILKQIIKMRDKGLDVSEAAKLAEEMADESRIFFTADTLEYLHRGGRIGGASAFLGGLLNLKPVLTLVEGMVQPVTKVRGMKKTLETMKNLFAEGIKGRESELDYMVVQIMALEEAEEFKANVERETGIKINHPVMTAGVAIGTHLGPGGLGITYTKKFEQE